MKTALEFLTKKVTDPIPEMGYEDFNHYCDCRHEDQMTVEIPRWTEEYANQKPEQVGEEEFGPVDLTNVKPDKLPNNSALKQGQPEQGGEDEYIPYGPEWEKEVMKMTKADIVKFYKSAIKQGREPGSIM